MLPRFLSMIDSIGSSLARNRVDSNSLPGKKAVLEDRSATDSIPSHHRIGVDGPTARERLEGRDGAAQRVGDGAEQLALLDGDPAVRADARRAGGEDLPLELSATAASSASSADRAPGGPGRAVAVRDRPPASRGPGLPGQRHVMRPAAAHCRHGPGPPGRAAPVRSGHRPIGPGCGTAGHIRIGGPGGGAAAGAWRIRRGSPGCPPGSARGRRPRTPRTDRARAAGASGRPSRPGAAAARASGRARAGGSPRPCGTAPARRTVASRSSCAARTASDFWSISRARTTARAPKGS